MPVQVELLGDDEVVECSDLVVFGGLGVDPDCLEPGVSEQLGDGDQVGAAAYEAGGEGVSQDVGGGLLVQAGGLGVESRRRSARPW